MFASSLARLVRASVTERRYRAPAFTAVEGIMAQSPNHLLDILPQAIFDALRPNLKDIDLVFADVVAEPDKPVSKVYFPHSGVISLVIELETGNMIETAMVGRDGAVNATSALDG